VTDAKSFEHVESHDFEFDMLEVFTQSVPNINSIRKTDGQVTKKKFA
jgi:hypothetical protein